MRVRRLMILIRVWLRVLKMGIRIKMMIYRLRSPSLFRVGNWTNLRKLGSIRKIIQNRSKNRNRNPKSNQNPQQPQIPNPPTNK
jgi:hypothetical protein